MHYLVLDFGGSSVKCAVMTESAETIEHFSIESEADSYTQWLERFTPTFEHYHHQYDFAGIAISTCGSVDVDTGQIFGSSALPYIHGVDVRSLYQQRFHIPVELENDGCCAALAESWMGEGRQSPNFCTFVIGTGIGGAIVIDNQVYKGQQLHGGEFGRMIAEYRDDNPVALGEIASTRALVEKVAESLSIPVEQLNGLEVFKRYDAGDEVVFRVVDNWFKSLAIGIYNIQYCVDPELIILGGAVSKREGFVACLNEKLDAILAAVPTSMIRPEIRVSGFGNDANLVGALRHFLLRQGN